MSLCDGCLAEKNKWIDSVQDLAQQHMCKPRDRNGRYSTKPIPFKPGQRGRNATELVRSQIALIEKHCERAHGG